MGWCGGRGFGQNLAMHTGVFTMCLRVSLLMPHCESQEQGWEETGWRKSQEPVLYSGPNSTNVRREPSLRTILETGCISIRWVAEMVQRPSPYRHMSHSPCAYSGSLWTPLVPGRLCANLFLCLIPMYFFLTIKCYHQIQASPVPNLCTNEMFNECQSLVTVSSHTVSEKHLSS